MTRLVFPLISALLSLGLLGSVSGQSGDAQPAKLRIFVPAKNAKLYFDDTETKSTGEERTFVTPKLAPGKIFSYTLKVVWDKGKDGSTKISRTRTVNVQAGGESKLDMRIEDKMEPDSILYTKVPTPFEVVNAMCKFAKVGKEDVVYDLGSGDGRIVIAAIKNYDARRGVGLEIDTDLVKQSNDNAEKARILDRVRFRQQDVLTLTPRDISDATVVMLYMGEDINERLMPILKEGLPPGARIVSHDFKMGKWAPTATLTVTDDDDQDHTLYMWTIPKE